VEKKTALSDHDISKQNVLASVQVVLAILAARTSQGSVDNAVGDFFVLKKSQRLQRNLFSVVCSLFSSLTKSRKDQDAIRESLVLCERIIQQQKNQLHGLQDHRRE
jgi:hypothetical protein